MTNFLKIKPYSVPNDGGYGFANAIMWVVPELYRGSTESKLYCILVNISKKEVVNQSGQIEYIDMVSPPLMNFEMMVDETLLNNWGPDSVIDDFVLTYDPNFEKE